MLVEELCDWWSNGWGWWYPLQHTIETIRDDRIYKLALLKIRKRIEKDGFVEYIKSYTGIPPEQKEKYFAKKFGQCYDVVVCQQKSASANFVDYTLLHEAIT